MGVFTRSRSGRVACPADLRAGLELDKPYAAQTSSLCGLSVSLYCVATCPRIWICRCQTTVLNTSVCMKPTAGSGNACACEKLHDRSRIRLRQKAGVCASALKMRALHTLDTCGSNHATTQHSNPGAQFRNTKTGVQVLKFLSFVYLSGQCQGPRWAMTRTSCIVSLVFPLCLSCYTSDDEVWLYYPCII